MTIISSTSSASSVFSLTKSDLERQDFMKKPKEIEEKAGLEAKDSKVVEIKNLKDTLVSLQRQLSHTTDSEEKAKLLSAIEGVCKQIGRLTVEVSMG